MSVDRNLLSEFAKITNDTQVNTQTQLYGTVVTQGDKKYVKMDGSDIITPIISTTDIKDGERVMVSINNHIATVTGNITNPSAGNDRVSYTEGKVNEFDYLFAGNITAGNIAANSITSDKILAGSITTDKLMAECIISDKIAADAIESKHIKADAIESEHIKAGSIEAEHIKAGIIESDHISSGTITADKIATGTITAGSGVIADGAIGNAQISSLDVAKLESGTIDTSKIYIAGADGHLQLKGNRLQVFDGLGNQAKERVSLGDVNGDGSKFGLRVRGADGETILLDENGVTSEGITDGSITNNKISDDANIDGAKLNINSVVTEINDNGTEVIKGTKISVNGTNLETKLSTIETKQTTQGNTISQHSSKISANEKAISLKVDNQTYTTDKQNMTTQLNKNTSSIEALKGEISLKVEQTDIENAKSELEGAMDSKINSAKSEIKITTDAIKQNVSNLSQTVSTKADGSTVSSLNSKVSSLETSVNGISGKVTSLEKTTTTLGTQVNTANTNASSALNKANSATTTANNAQNTANINKSNITNLQGEVSTVKSNVASLEVTTSEISQKVSSVESTTTTLSGKVNTANNNATNALNKANSANTLADSKAKVFTSTPTVPYKVGDLWVQGTNGDVMKCKTARASGSYTASDWEKASKYTDDTKANAVDGKVTTLQGTVNKTNSKVATIETNLNGITQRVSSTESTTATLTTKVNNAQNTADNANNKLEGLKIGGTNLLKGTKDFSTGKGNATIDATKYYNFTVLKNNVPSTGYADMCQWTNLSIKPNTEYTLSFYAKASVNGAKHYSYLYPDAVAVGSNSSGATTNAPDGAIITTLTTEWKRYWVTWKTRSTLSGVKSMIPMRILSSLATTGVTTYICGVHFEEGNRSTDWSPSPEDVSQDATNKSNQALTDAKNYTNTQITTVNNKVASIQTDLSGITSRVTNTENNIKTTNNNVTSLTNRVATAESKITETAITNTVKKNFYTKSETNSQITSKGYQTSSQVQQTVDALQMKFEQSGGYNLLKNSAFKNGANGWSALRWDSQAGGNSGIGVRNIGDDWTITNRNSLDASVTNLPSTSVNKPLRAGFDSHKFKVRPNTTYTLNCLMAQHRTRSITIEMLCYDSADNRIGTSNYDVTLSNVKSGGRDRNNWTKVKHTWTTPSNAVTCHLRAFMNEWTGESNSAFMWICEPLITEGNSNLPWTPNADEVYTGITTIDKDGIKVNQNNISTRTTMDASSFRVENNTGGTVAEFSRNSQIPNLTAGIINANEIYANNIVRKSTHVKNYYVAGGYGNDVSGAGGNWNNPCKTVQYVLDNYVEDVLDYDVNIYVGQSVPGWTCKSKSGKGVISFLIQDDCIVGDPLYLDNCTNRIAVHGTDAQKGTFMTGIVVTGCHNFDIGWVSFRGKNWAHNSGSCNVLVRSGSKGIIRCNDFNGCTFAIIVDNNSEIWLYKNRGSDITHYIGIGAYTTIYGMRSGSDVCPDFTGYYYADAGHVNLYHIHDGANHSKTPSIGWSPSYTPSQKTQTWDFNNIWSDETLRGWSDRQELIQGYASTWNTGRWTGYMQMTDDFAAIRNTISGGTNLSGRIYIQRTSSSGNSTGSKLCLYGSDGTLITNSTSINRGQGVWVSLSSSIIQKIQSGAIKYFYLKADTDNKSTYFKCERNCKIEITYTK